MQGASSSSLGSGIKVLGASETAAEGDSSGLLPFTGSSALPLIGIGVVLTACGVGLVRRRRRLAR